MSLRAARPAPAGTYLQCEASVRRPELATFTSAAALEDLLRKLDQLQNFIKLFYFCLMCDNISDYNLL